MQIIVQDKIKIGICYGTCLGDFFAGLHTSVTLSFLIAGHTKFSLDWCFGMFKSQFWRINVS